MRGPQVRHGGIADAFHVALAEFRSRGFQIHQAAADDDDAGVEGHGQIGDVDAHDAGLEIKNLQREGIALLGAGAEGENLFLDGRGGLREFMLGMFLQEHGEQMRQAGDGRVGFDTAPIATAAAGQRFVRDAEHLQRHGGVAGFHAGEGVAIQRQAVRPHESRAEAGTGHKHHDGRLGMAARDGRLGDAAVVAIVPGDERDGTAGFLGEGVAVIFVEIPALEGSGHVGGSLKNAVTFVRSGNGEAHARDLGPDEAVGGKKVIDAGDPAADDGPGAVEGGRGLLLKLLGDGFAVFPDGGDLGSGRAAVGADENLASGAHVWLLNCGDWRQRQEISEFPCSKGEICAASTDKLVFDSPRFR